MVRSLLFRILEFFGLIILCMLQRSKGASWIIKQKKCIFVSYKDGVKVYKLWNPVTRKIVYSRDVVFREVKNTSRNEDEPKEKGPKKMEFELKNEGSDSFEEESSELDVDVEL